MRLTDDQIEFLQAFIDHLPPGIYDAMDIIPKTELEYFAPPTVHGVDFAQAVAEGKLMHIEARGMARGSKHMRYALHGG